MTLEHPTTDSSPRQRETSGDARFVLHRVPWWTSVALRDALDQQGNVKMTYLRGTLELTSPSILHQDVKTILLATFVRPGESQTRLARDYQNALRASP